MSTSSATAAGSSLRTVQVEPEHHEALACFQRQFWDPAATEQSVADARAREADRNPAQPGEAPPAFLFFQDDKPVAHIGTIPMRVWTNGATRPGYWFNGFMVIPELRGGPIGWALLKDAVRRVPMAAALTVQPASRRLFEAVGFKHVGTVANYVRPLAPGTMLQKLDLAALGLELPRALVRAVGIAQQLRLPRLAGGAARLALDALAALRSPGANRSIVAAALTADDGELDALWASVRGQLRAAMARDAAFVRWRYDPERYLLVEVREAGVLRGWAALRRPRVDGDPRLRGIRVATVSDVLFPASRPDLAAALLAGVERAARAARAEALLCSASHPALQGALERRMYRGLPGNLQLLVRDASGDTAPLDDIAAWWITRGDANADEVF